MYFFRFFLMCFLFVLGLYYGCVMLHMIGAIKITKQTINWKIIIPFYYFFK